MSELRRIVAKKAFTYEYARPAATADVVLITREAQPRVLLIRRAREPFAGTWALPGGFVNPDESIVDAAKRELHEETGLEIATLEPLYTTGDPGRDPRGWTISIAFLARVESGELQPKAGDDAAAVKWFRLNKLPELAFDHAMLVRRAIARIADRAA